jgi:hypothetical protein
MKLVFPTIHLNGDRASVLLEDHCDAMRSLRAAISDLPEVNGRNYYPQGEDALTAAIAQRERWVRVLTDVQKEVEDVAERIADQVK